MLDTVFGGRVHVPTVRREFLTHGTWSLKGGILGDEEDRRGWVAGLGSHSVMVALLAFTHTGHAELTQPRLSTRQWSPRWRSYINMRLIYYGA